MGHREPAGAQRDVRRPPGCPCPGQSGGPRGFRVCEPDGSQGPEAENITGVRAVFLDLDGKPLPPEWPLNPHFVNETSLGRFHAFWFVSEGFPLNLFTGVQKTIAAQFGGDPSVCDLPRVMRLPGFLHQKQAPFPVQIIQDWSADPPYTLDEILRAFPPDTSGTRTPVAGGPEPPDDPVLEALEEKGLFLGPGRDAGMFRLVCPWAQAHTTGTAEAAYFRPNYGGYAGPGFKCQHAHCADRTIKDLRKFLGLPGNNPQTVAESVLLSDVIPEPVAWLWRGYLPAGKLSNSKFKSHRHSLKIFSQEAPPRDIF